MPDFQGTDPITLQPTEDGVPFRFIFTVQTAVDSNDGAIPFGDVIDVCIVKGYDAEGNDVTSELVSNSTKTDTVVTVVLDYPSTSGDGRYKLTFQITTANGIQLEFDFNRVQAKDH